MHLVLKSNLAKLKATIDAHKLKTIPADKKIVYDELVAKVNSVDTSGFALKTKYNTDI